MIIQNAWSTRSKLSSRACIVPPTWMPLQVPDLEVPSATAPAHERRRPSCGCPPRGRRRSGALVRRRGGPPDQAALPACRPGSPEPPSGTAQGGLTQYRSSVGGVGAGVPPTPSVLSHACLYRPSAKIFCSASLIWSRPCLSFNARPIPYGSWLNGSPTTWSWPAYFAEYPARMMSSVLTASTLLPISAVTHLE